VVSKTSFCDVGCAAGEFLYFLHSLPEAQLKGIDVVPELLEKTRAMVPTASIDTGSIIDPNALEASSFDVLFFFCSGVVQIFDDFKLCLSNLISWCKPGGRIYIAGIFNPFPIDVWIQYRKSSDPDEHREPGWNLFSEESMGKFLHDSPKCHKYVFHDFKMPFDISKHEHDFMRTWTMKGDGERILTNGLSLLCQNS